MWSSNLLALSSLTVLARGLWRSGSKSKRTVPRTIVLSAGREAHLLVTVAAKAGSFDPNLPTDGVWLARGRREADEYHFIQGLSGTQ